MLGANFIDARNSEVDRQRRLRSENAQAFNAFVESQKATGARVNPAEFESFRRSLATNPYMNAALPSVSSVRNTAARINTEVARREAAYAQAQRDAAMARERAQFAGITELTNTLTASGVDVTSPQGQSTLSQMAQAQYGVSPETFQNYTSVIPGLANSAIVSTAQSTVQTLAGNGITTLEAAEPFLRHLPESQRNAVTAMFTAQTNAQNEQDAQTAATLVNDEMLSSWFTGANGDAAEALRAYHAWAATTDLGKHPGTAAATRARVESYFNNAGARSVAGARVAANDSTIVTNEELTILQRSGDFETRARGLLQSQGVINPTPEDIASVSDVLRSRASAGAVSRSAASVETGRATLSTTLADPNGGTNEALRGVNSTVDARSFIESHMPTVDLSNMTQADQSAMLRHVLNAADIARNVELDADNAAFTALLNGFSMDGQVDNSDSADFNEKVVSALAGGDPEVLAVFNDARVSLGLEPFGSTADPDFRAALETARINIRSLTRARSASTIEAIEQTAQTRMEERTQSQEGRLAAAVAGQEDGSALKLLIESGINRTYYLGAVPAQTVVSTAEAYLRDNPSIAQAIQRGDAGAAFQAAQAVATSVGIVLMGDALPYERRAAAAAHSGPEWATVPYDQNVSTYLNGEMAPLHQVIAARIAQIEALPSDTPLSEVVALRQGVADTLNAHMDAVRTQLSEGALRYILDFSETQSTPLTLLLDNASAELATRLANLDGALPKGDARNERAQVDGTVIVSAGNARGLTPGIYEGVVIGGRIEANPDRRITDTYNGMPISRETGLPYYPGDFGGRLGLTPTSPSMVRPGFGTVPANAAPYVPTDIYDRYIQVDPGASPFVQDVQGAASAIGLAPNDYNRADTLLRNTVANIATGGTELPSGSLAARGWNYMFGTEEEQALRAQTSTLMGFLNSEAARQALAANPSSAELLASDPMEWARRAGMPTQ